MSSLTRCALAAAVSLAMLTPALAAPAAKPFSVRSTLRGKTVLPHRIHWLAFPSLPPAQIKQVDFLVDGGKPRWTEEHKPYVYSEDEGKHVGYLVTSWLAPGRHRFVVRAISKDGRTATETVTARVLAGPAPPTALVGTWKRVIDTTDAPEPGTPGNPTDTFTPSGSYTMVVDKRWIQVRFPGKFHLPQSDDTGEGWILDSDYTGGAAALRVLGAVTFDTFHHQAEFGWWCYSDGPSADYTWSVTAETLTLTPRGGSDPCGVRGFIWSGEWKRAG